LRATFLLYVQNLPDVLTSLWDTMLETDLLVIGGIAGDLALRLRGWSLL